MLAHLVGITLLLASPPAAAPASCFESLVPSADDRRHISLVKGPRLDAGLERAFRRNVEKNLAEKCAMRAVDASYRLTPEQIQRTVFAYERFKLETFVSSGVFPKRYFGYFDEQFDTAVYEKTLKTTVHRAVEVLNAATPGESLRFTDAEVAVTFLAEGGAILLREKQGQLESIHPVYGLGLDDLATGLAKEGAAAAALDAALGTQLTKLVTLRDGQPYLTRMMTFKEAIAGTALMYRYEKKLAAERLRASEGKELASLSLDQQYVAASLVYNSGELFSAESRERIRRFDTAAQLVRVSRLNEKRRGLLPVLTSDDARERLRRADGYPEQPTSWSGMYHVLQRYGAFTAMRRFTDVFDARGMFTR